MPHIILEHSANLGDDHDVESLIASAHSAALSFDFIPPAGLRTRAASREHFSVATGDVSYGFIAVVARIGPGRTAEQKTGLIAALLDAVETELGIDGASDDPVSSGGLRLALSCEVQEIDAEFRANRNHVRPHVQTSQIAQNNPTESTL